MLREKAEEVLLANKRKADQDPEAIDPREAAALASVGKDIATAKLLNPSAEMELARVQALQELEDMAVAWDGEEPTVGEAFLMDAAGPKALDNLSRYETALWNTYLKLCKRLEELQAIRLAKTT